MPHRDVPGGRQYHIRYRVEGHRGGPYWSAVFDNVLDAAAEKAYLDGSESVHDVQIFIRDVTPWRPDDRL